MTAFMWSILATGGLISGILAGFLGIGGGVILVPMLVSLGYTPLQAVATSSLAIVVTSVSGSLNNWKMGYFDYKRVLYLGLPAIATAPIGVYIGNLIPAYLLLIAFGVLLLVNIYLVELRKKLSQSPQASKIKFNPVLSRIATGGIAGILAGLLGIGGGVILVPLQMLLLQEPIKLAIQTSLGAIVATAVSACVVQAYEGNILLFQGLLLGSGGLLGAQLSTRILPKLADSTVRKIFRLFLATLAIYMFWQAWQIWQTSS